MFSTGTSEAPPASEPSPEGVSAESSSRGVTVTVRAAKDIRAGQEILHCYGKKKKERKVESIDGLRAVFGEKMIQA